MRTQVKNKKHSHLKTFIIKIQLYFRANIACIITHLCHEACSPYRIVCMSQRTASRIQTNCLEHSYSHMVMIFARSISATLFNLIYIPCAFGVGVWAHFPEHCLVIDPITFANKVKTLKGEIKGANN